MRKTICLTRCRLYTLLLFIFILFSCLDSNENDPILLVTDTEFSVVANGGVIETNIISTNDYLITISADVSWVQRVMITKAVSYSKIKFNVDKNDTGKERSAKITNHH